MRSVIQHRGQHAVMDDAASDPPQVFGAGHARSAFPSSWLTSCIRGPRRGARGQVLNNGVIGVISPMTFLRPGLGPRVHAAVRERPWSKGAWGRKVLRRLNGLAVSGILPWGRHTSLAHRW